MFIKNLPLLNPFVFIICCEFIEVLLYHFHQPYLEKVLGEVSGNWDEKPSLIQYYYLAYQMLLQLKDKGFTPVEESDNYQQLKEILLDPGAPVAKAERKELMEIAVNFCTLSQNDFRNNGRIDIADQFVEELRLTYEFQLEHKIIFEKVGGTLCLDHGDFINIVTIFAGLGKWEWVEDFIARYAGQLHKNYTGNLRKKLVEEFQSLAIGILLYKKGEIEEARRTLFRTINGLKETHDQFCALKSRVYYVRCLFETGEYYQCSHFLSGFNRNLRSKVKQGEVGLSRYVQFVKHARKLCLILLGDPDKKKAALSELENSLADVGQCVSLEWLLERIELHR